MIIQYNKRDNLPDYEFKRFKFEFYATRFYQEAVLDSKKINVN